MIGEGVENWNKVVKEHAASVLNAALRITGNLTDAEDVSQEVFAEAFQKFDTFRHGQIGGLLRRMAVCRAIDFLRTKKRWEPLPFHLEERGCHSALEVLAAEEVEIRLRKIISELPPREAQVFCLVYFEQMPNAKISDMLDLSKNAVAKSLSKARTKINTRFTGVFRRI